MPYNEEVSNTKTIADVMKGRLAKFTQNATKTDVKKYQFYVSEACKLTGDTYMKMHRRICYAFGDAKVEYVLRKLSEWVHYAEKTDNKGMAFNGVFKKWRESQK